MESINNKNPFANKDGSPIDGKEPDFFEWEKQRAISELKNFPPEIQKEIIESERALAKRMDSFDYVEHISKLAAGIKTSPNFIKPEIGNPYEFNHKEDMFLKLIDKEIDNEMSKGENGGLYEPKLIIKLVEKQKNYIFDIIHTSDVNYLYETPVLKNIIEYKYYLESAVMNDGPGNKLTNQQLLKSVSLLFDREKERVSSGINEPNIQPIEEPELFFRFDNTAQKYILLEELGIINFINEKFPFNSNSKRALLLAYITDSKNSKSFENIISQLANSNSEHYPYREKNEIKVSNILDQLGIPTKKSKRTAVKISNKK